MKKLSLVKLIAFLGILSLASCGSDKDGDGSNIANRNGNISGTTHAVSTFSNFINEVQAGNFPAHQGNSEAFLFLADDSIVEGISNNSLPNGIHRVQLFRGINFQSHVVSQLTSYQIQSDSSFDGVLTTRANLIASSMRSGANILPCVRNANQYSGYYCNQFAIPTGQTTTAWQYEYNNVKYIIDTSRSLMANPVVVHQL